MRDLAAVQHGNTAPVIIRGGVGSTFRDVAGAGGTDLSGVAPGDVVALVGDYTPESINSLIRLADLKAIVVPLTAGMEASFPYFFGAAGVNAVVRDGRTERVTDTRHDHPLLNHLRALGHSGLVLFSSGTTGQPKAVLHDFDLFLSHYRFRRQAPRTMNFLVFDHISGINTLFSTLFNRGQVIVPSGRTPWAVLDDIERHGVEVLPATPTFLRMLLLSGLLEQRRGAIGSLRTVTYSTEPMDQATLDRYCAMLPGVDFRQSYGMSELGMMRVKSRSRDSLFISVGGDGVETRVDGDSVLHIRAQSRSLGYLNAPMPFLDGWYNTGDVVEEEGGHLRIVGRMKQVINVGGIKILPDEIERVALLYPGVVCCKAEGVSNPIIGQHIEVTCEMAPGSAEDRAALKAHFAVHLAPAVQPHRIRVGPVSVNHRFKKL
jgi:acyl-coenzyme A synthetase/AMP-(fatty) acid ligase